MAKETIDVLNALILIIGTRNEAVEHLAQLHRLIYPSSYAVAEGNGGALEQAPGALEE